MDYVTQLTYDQVANMYAEKGYLFDGGPYRLNIVAFRNKDLETVDEFNDHIGLAYRDHFDNKIFLPWACTTKPGLAYLGQTMGNGQGTAIVCPGQHLNCWKLGYHHRGQANQYEAFEQSGPGVFKVWRDGDKDGKLDFGGKVYMDGSGINGHHAAAIETFKVGPWSAGCQVWKEDKEHLIAVAVAKRHCELYANSFHYTLFQLQ